MDIRFTALCSALNSCFMARLPHHHLQQMQQKQMLTLDGGKRAKGCHKLHKFLITTADKMQPREDTDDIAFDRWGQLQLLQLSRLLLLLLHQQPKMATWSCLSSAGIRKCSNHCSSHVQFASRMCRSLLPPATPFDIIPIHTAAICNWVAVADNNNNYEQQQNGNNVACTLPFDSTIKPESIQQLRMRYPMAYGICDARQIEQRNVRCTTKAVKTVPQTYRTC